MCFYYRMYKRNRALTGFNWVRIQSTDVHMQKQECSKETEKLSVKKLRNYQ